MQESLHIHTCMGTMLDVMAFIVIKQKLTFTLNPSFAHLGKDGATRPHNHVHLMDHWIIWSFV
jgi:hypothetical protein